MSLYSSRKIGSGVVILSKFPYKEKHVRCPMLPWKQFNSDNFSNVSEVRNVKDPPAEKPL